jgi:hypothetical protein
MASSVQSDGVSLEGLDPLGGRLEQLVGEIRERPRRCQVLTDHWDVWILRRALGLPQITEPLPLFRDRQALGFAEVLRRGDSAATVDHAVIPREVVDCRPRLPGIVNANTVPSSHLVRYSTAWRTWTPNFPMRVAS